MSRAQALRARVGGSIDRAWGEGFTFVPRTRPAGDPDAHFVADPYRVGFDFAGRWTGSAQDLHARNRNTSMEMTRAVSSESPKVTATVENFPAGTAREGDVLIRLADGFLFTISKVGDGAFGRLVFHLRPGQK